MILFLDENERGSWFSVLQMQRVFLTRRGFRSHTVNNYTHNIAYNNLNIKQSRESATRGGGVYVSLARGIFFPCKTVEILWVFEVVFIIANNIEVVFFTSTSTLRTERRRHLLNIRSWGRALVVLTLKSCVSRSTTSPSQARAKLPKSSNAQSVGLSGKSPPSRRATTYSVRTVCPR